MWFSTSRMNPLDVMMLNASHGFNIWKRRRKVSFCSKWGAVNFSLPQMIASCAPEFGWETLVYVSWWETELHLSTLNLWEKVWYIVPIFLQPVYWISFIYNKFPCPTTHTKQNPPSTKWATNIPGSQVCSLCVIFVHFDGTEKSFSPFQIIFFLTADPRVLCSCSV
jgi:hypothetical protein